MINEKFKCWTYIFEVTRHNGSMTDVARPQILFSILKFRTSGGRWPSFTATLELWCCNRSPTSVVLQLCPATLEMFSIWNFSVIIYHFGVITASGLRRLLSISGVPIRRATSVIFHCVGRPRKCRLNIWNFSPITCRSGFNTTSGRRWPCLISVNHGRQGAENTI
jgi:hypothetical protein